MATKLAKGTRELASEIRGALDASADDETRRKYERLVPGAKVLGVRVPELRALATQARRDHPDLTLEQACDLLDAYAAKPIREEMLVAIFLIGRFGKAIDGVPWPRIEGWTKSLDNWEVCDQLAANIAARVVHANPRHVPALVRLASSRDPWVRRFTLATAADLSHAGRANVDVAFDICRALLADTDAMIQTSIAWALREASKADELATFTFLKHASSKMRPKTLRDAAEKLSATHRSQLGLAAS